MTRAPTRSITYTFPDELIDLDLETLLHSIIEKINAQQDIFLVLDKTIPLSPAPNSFPKKICVLHSWIVQENDYNITISAKISPYSSAILYTKEQLLDIVWKNTSVETILKWQIDDPIRIFYDKRNQRIDITWREYKKLNPMIKH